MDKAKQFKDWMSERMGHSWQLQLAREAIIELEAQIEFKIKECQELAQACNRYKNQLSTKKVTVLTDLRDAIQPDGLINSDAGTKTIQAITCAIDAIIDLEND